MTSSEKSYDAIVVGARCAGAATAMLLARSGWRVLVLDRSALGRDTLSTHALMRGGVIQLKRWGLLDRVIAQDTPLVQTTTFHYDGERIEIPLKEKYGTLGLYAPRRTVLDPILVDAAREAGAEVTFGATVIDVLFDANGTVSGVVADLNGQTRIFEAKVVIGADGMRSSTAALIGAESYRRGTHATACAFSYWADAQVPGYEWYFTKGSGAGAIPTNDGLTCVFASVPPSTLSRSDAQVRELFAQTLRHTAPGLAKRLEGATLVSGFKRAFGTRGYLRQCFGPGWALVGDAAYFKDPLTAHGMTDAFIGAEILARTLIERGPSSLAAYQQMRDALAIDFFEATDRIASLDWEMETLKAAHLELSEAMQSEVRAILEWERVANRAA